MLDPKALDTLIKKYGLQKVADKVKGVALSSICISTKKIDEDKLPLGVSKIGGSPDLPARTKWPEWKGVPMQFLAQFDLKDTAKFDVESLLPKEGRLLFFYDWKEMVFGFDPADKGGWKIFFFDNKKTKLTRMDQPNEMDNYHNHPACALKFRCELTLPAFSSQAAVRAGIGDAEWDGYYNMNEQISKDRQEKRGRLHQVLGHPFQIQNDMALSSQMASNGVYMGDGSCTENPRFEKLFKGIDQWRLLFQLDSDDECNMQWSDMGMLYFWIKKDDLQKKAFDKCWFELQCY